MTRPTATAVLVWECPEPGYVRDTWPTHTIHHISEGDPW